ncbi:MAG: phosphoadenylyl-sulfate reductase [Myxococcota bacterium]
MIAETEAILRQAAHVGRAALSTAFGPGGIVLLDLVQRLELDVDIHFLDTGFHFPETLELVRTWQDRGLDIQIVSPELSPLTRVATSRLYATDPDRCCHLRKVEPNLRALEGADVWITSLRRDQGGRRATVPVEEEVTLPDGHRIRKVAPLAAWTRDQVWAHIEAHELPTNPLHAHGYPSVGCAPCTAAVGPGGAERDGRWAGRAKTECGLHLHPNPSERVAS